MEQSILVSTKKVLGVSEEDTSFDLDIIMHINAALGILHQLGVGTTQGTFIEDDTTEWDDLFPLSDPQLHLLKTCVFLRVRMLFDPPTTTYLMAAVEKQITEHEWRLSSMREETEWVDPDPPVVVTDE